ncbi:MAG TPA: hypothetical protein PLW80_06530 [Spirochaetales bacterium]|nr:hypothetical protein [Spirochaetales bacterium]
MFYLNMLDYDDDRGHGIERRVDAKATDEADGGADVERVANDGGEATVGDGRHGWNVGARVEQEAGGGRAVVGGLREERRRSDRALKEQAV